MAEKLPRVRTGSKRGKRWPVIAKRDVPAIDDLDRELVKTGGRYEVLGAIAAREGRPIRWVMTRYHRAVAACRAAGLVRP